MVRLIKKYEDREYRTEAKQVGTLYHVCTLSALVDYIIPENQLSASGKYHNDLLDTYDAISFTRDSLFVVPTWTVGGAGILFQFVIDGDKLSEHYKVSPYQALDWTKNRPTWSEKEEVVIGPIKNFKSYIKEVKFDIKSISPNDLIKLLEPLEKVKEYLGSIKCTRTILPYHSGNNKHNYKKTKNELELYKIKTLDDLIQYVGDIKGIKVSDYSNTLLNTIDSIDLFNKYYEDLSDDQLIILLKSHPKWVNVKDNDGFTPLYKACSNSDTEVAKLLLELGADVNIKDNKGYTPLYNACFYNHTEVAKLLIEHGADVNFKNMYGNTPLSQACDNDNTELVKLLLEHGADKSVNTKDEDGDTPLYEACSNNNIELVRLLIEYGAEVNIKNKDGRIPLYRACLKDNIELVKLLLEHGADKSVNSIDASGFTPLYWACKNNNIELVKLLLEHGADVNSKGYTPLYWACWNENTEVVKLLLEHGAWKDLDADNLPEYITRNKDIEDLTLSYLNKNKNESKRRMYEFAQGNIMNKVKEYDAYNIGYSVHRV